MQVRGRLTIVCGCLMLVVAVLAPGEPARAFDGYGTLSGQFVLKGDIPEREVIVKKGDQTKKDADVCAANDLLSDELIVDPETKGIANVFVYIRKFDKGKIHPDLASTPKDKLEVVFDQEGCRFFPHALFLRTDQTVVVKSGDNCAHNTHTNPIRNSPQNFIVQANDRKGVKLTHTSAESQPIKVNCDIHGWMSANWLILDHPYAAVTDEQGRFTIEKLPEGEHEIRVWHERVGYINIGKDLKFSGKLGEFMKVNIDKPEVKLDPIEVPVEKLAKK